MEKDLQKAEIISAMMNVEYYPAMLAEETSVENYMKLPLASISTLGVAFSSLMTPFNSITQSIDVGAREGYFKAIFPEGVYGELMKAKNGVGYRGVIKGVDGKFARQPTFIPETGNFASVTTSIPYDPAMLFMAAALMNINKKLDSIQEFQQEIMEFFVLKEKSKLKGNLHLLEEVLNNYKYNWNNEKYKTNKHIQVQEIKREAEHSIIFYREEIEKKVNKKSPFHSDIDVKNILKKILREFKDYQLALYLYSFASFLEVMLLENFKKEYLDSVVNRMEDYSYQYREIYTKCHVLIEEYSKTSVHAKVINGLSSINRAAGDAIAKIPIVSKSQMDENLIKTSKVLGRFGSRMTEKNMEQFVGNQSSCVRPFVENINMVNRLYNQPMELLFDKENVYFSLT